MATHRDEGDHRPRKHDHLVEPMYSGLGLEREQAGSDLGAEPISSGEAPSRATPKGIFARLGSLLGRWRGRPRS